MEVSDDTERAYRVLVSEVMLQQTQVERVKETFVRFLHAFPTLRDLASASNKEVILAWRGMGYNSRALRLRDAARMVVERQGGVFPREQAALRAIKGIGDYTASAILNFAFNIPAPCLDTNIRRILHRTFVGPENPDGTWRRDDRYLLKLAGEVLEAALRPHPRDARNWHAALMDFGSLVQTKTQPQWDACPLTARGLMKTTAKNFPKHRVRSVSSEPGRVIDGRFIPNRIIRGRIVEALRDAPRGLPLPELGAHVCADWSLRAHQRWLREILDGLRRDALIRKTRDVFALADG
ncbi:MAG: hypothetical protein PHI23_01230 [Candidatus Peribacteraceae bacterium]|nr:hypothetical protein [Candidatus Peribacteraceae bacterium]